MFSRRFYSSLPPTIKQLLLHPPQPDAEITVFGNVRSVRSLKKVAFIDLSDNSTNENLMCVTKPENVSALKTGQSVQISGNWKLSKGKEQSFELSSKEIKILGQVPENYQLQKKFHSLNYLRTLPSLRWKTSYLSSVLRFRSYLDFKLNEFFQSEDFFKVNPPIITSSDCEGAGELFQLESKSLLNKNEKFFNKDAFLTVSTQLHLEVLSNSIGKVWSLSPTFRAESSDTNRHLAEFWMLEAEISYITDLNQLTNFTEKMIKFLIKPLLENNHPSKDLLSSLPREGSITSEELYTRWESLYHSKWISIDYNEAIEILRKSNKQFKIPINYEEGLATEHEKYLAGEHFNNTPVFIKNYPKPIKPFYMLQNHDDTVACFDLIFPQIGEIIGGSLREHDYDKLINEMQKRNMNQADMDWYLSTRINGSVPHGGFGLGFERLISYLTAVDNIRDVVPFPRARDECVA